MSNSYFQFKQFTIQQDKCAMKVCTDACLFGAWVADKIEDNKSIHNILDIGAGTGLLSLMLAQKTNACIDAIELNEEAAIQASENFNDSSWKERLKIFQQNIVEFEPLEKYDLIISNPPFFENDLKSDDKNRNAAMHSTTLNLEVLLQQIKRLLKNDGMAAVLIPYQRSEYFENLLNQNDFFINESLRVKQSVKHDFFRSQYIFSRIATQKEEGNLAIQDTERQYTQAFTALLKDYYLKL